jgi:hypothetical protein
MTIFVVFKPDNLPNDRTLLSVTRTGASASRGWLVQMLNSGDDKFKLRALFSSNGTSHDHIATSGTSKDRNGKLCLAVVEYDGRPFSENGTGVVSAQLDNEQRDVQPLPVGATTGVTIFNSVAPFRLAGHSQQSTDNLVSPFFGAISEVLVYNRLLQWDERNDVGGKLMARWGVPYLKVAEITGATSATPIVITSTNHGLTNGQIVSITGVEGNPAANGLRKVGSATQNNFALLDPVTSANIVGNGNYTQGGNWSLAQ